MVVLGLHSCPHLLSHLEVARRRPRRISWRSRWKLWGKLRTGALPLEPALISTAASSETQKNV